MLDSDPAFSQQPNMPYQESYDPTDYNNHQVYVQQPYGAEPAPPMQGRSSPFDHMQNETFHDDVEPHRPHQSYRGPASDDQGYAEREALASPKKRKGYFDFMSNKWAALFMAVTAIQFVVCLIFEAYVFAKFQQSLRSLDSRKVDGEGEVDAELSSQYKTIPTFLTLFIFAFLYELVVVWDALRMKNTIQVIGVCFANLALVVYTAIQVIQIRSAIDILVYYNSMLPGYSGEGLWSDVRPYLIAISAIIALGTFIMALFTWKLYQDFAWDILKIIGADYRMKKRFFYYQIYIALLKFDFFFFLGFIIQLVVIVTKTKDPEFALTIVTIPITIIILLCAGYFTRIENKPGMIVTIVLYFGGLTYFIFKLVRIWTWKSYYASVNKSLSAFAAVTILLIILTIVNAIICTRNFGHGLKTHLGATKKTEENPDVNSINLTDAKPQGNRMTID